MYLSLEKWEPPLLFLGTRRWKNCGYKFTIHCVCFSLRSSRTFSVLQSQGKPQIWEQSSWASLGGGEKTWKLSVSCSLKYPTAVVLWFLGARDWHQNLLHTPLILGGRWGEQGFSPWNRPKEEQPWVCRKKVSGLVVPPLHPLCLCASTWRAWWLPHVKSVSLIIIELILKKLTLPCDYNFSLW